MSARAHDVCTRSAHASTAARLACSHGGHAGMLPTSAGQSSLVWVHAPHAAWWLAGGTASAEWLQPLERVVKHACAAACPAAHHQPCIARRRCDRCGGCGHAMDAKLPLYLLLQPLVRFRMHGPVVAVRQAACCAVEHRAIGCYFHAGTHAGRHGPGKTHVRMHAMCAQLRHH